MEKIAILDKKISQERNQETKLRNQTKDELQKIFTIKTINALEGFDVNLRKKNTLMKL